MGKSPGKWIKGILFGKKSSKSNLSEGRELSRSASKKPERVSSSEPISTLIVDAPQIFNEVPTIVIDRTDISSFEKGEAAKLANDVLVSSSANQDGEIPSDPSPPNGSENIRLEQAATVVQTSLRSYQAHNELKTLKGIVRLQAIFRGRLVRRQAVATLFCVQGIVKIQAITRGHMVRQSNIGNGQCRRQSPVAKDTKRMDSCEMKYRPAANLLKNAFIHALLSSSPTVMPLQLQYSPGEPNSAWDWLLRWSISQMWVPFPKQKETVKTEQIRPKCNDLADAELENKGRKIPHQPVKSAQEHPQTGNNKVKRGIKKISKPTDEISNQAEIDIEKPKRYQRKLTKSPSPKFSEKTANTPIDKPMEDLSEALEDHPELYSEKIQDILPSGKDCQISSENCKSIRRTSLPSEYDDHDATPEIITRVPSYMAKTASSKAKVKVHVSPGFGQDAADKNGLTRRHSLPTLANGKLSLSPRVRVLVQATGGEGINIDRSLSSSRDNNDKVIQVEWKR